MSSQSKNTEKNRTEREEARADWEGMGQSAYTPSPRHARLHRLMRRVQARVEDLVAGLRAWLRTHGMQRAHR